MEKQPFVQALINNYQNNAGILKNGQIDEEVYAEWTGLVAILYDCSVRISQNRDWSNSLEVNSLEETSMLYETLAKIHKMIGTVNGDTLHMDSDKGCLFSGYASVGPNETEVQLVGSKKRRRIFRLRTELYFARKIIEQQLKPAQMLSEEQRDRNIIRSQVNSRRKMRKKKDLQSQKVAKAPEKPVTTAEKIPEKPVNTVETIDFTTVVVKQYSTVCNKKHTVEPVKAVVEIITPAGTIIKEEIAAGYCKECNIYFIYNYEYQRLKEEGIILCQVISKEVYNDSWSVGLLGPELKPESLLHRSGYNVGSVENLSSPQRQEVLKRVLDNKLYSKMELLSFLDWLIRRNEKSSKKNMAVAIQKWKTDRKFVEGYMLKDSRAVRVERIIR